MLGSSLPSPTTSHVSNSNSTSPYKLIHSHPCRSISKLIHSLTFKRFRSLLMLHGNSYEKQSPASSDVEVGSSSTYIGVRKRKWGKWVSEIREPGKKTRIWLGSFETPEMAAVAHDVAAFWLKGQDARLNFPGSVDRLPRPASSDPSDIRSAALEAALEVKFRQNIPVVTETSLPVSPTLQRVGSGSWAGSGFGLCGDEWGLDSPKMWSELAEALLLAPPQVLSSDMNELEVLQPGSLWDPLL